MGLGRLVRSALYREYILLVSLMPFFNYNLCGIRSNQDILHPASRYATDATESRQTIKLKLIVESPMFRLGIHAVIPMSLNSLYD